MAVYEKKSDLRSVKTKNALNAAMFSLLTKYHFRKIRMLDICGEALVNKATFYLHFADKYDLLKHWLGHIDIKSFYDGAYGQTGLNGTADTNKAILRNLIHDADRETYGILFDALASNFSANHGIGENGEQRHTVLSTFYAGGVLAYLTQMVSNDFPLDAIPMNTYAYEIAQTLREWELE